MAVNLGPFQRVVKINMGKVELGVDATLSGTDDPSTTASLSVSVQGVNVYSFMTSPGTSANLSYEFEPNLGSVMADHNINPPPDGIVTLNAVFITSWGIFPSEAEMKLTWGISKGQENDEREVSDRVTGGGTLSLSVKVDLAALDHFV